MAFNTGSDSPSLDWKFHSMPVLDVKTATEKIKKGEASYTFAEKEKIGLVSRVDTVQVASNEPMEDVMVSSKVDVGNGQVWHAWAIYDGHGGPHTARVLAHALIPYVERSLQAHFQAPGDSGIESAIISAFQSLDNDILNDGLDALENAKSHAEVQARLAPCYAGSCALLALYDPVQSQVYVANTGDSRAVLGRAAAAAASEQGGGGKGPFECMPLSTDQNAFNTAEIERVTAMHPDEQNLITKRDGDCPRYVGIAVTRAFGDARWKWSREALKKCEEGFSGKPPAGNMPNPPYLEATPTVTSFKLKGEAGEFIIMASDGLWNHLSSEDAVYGVGKWIDAVKNKTLAAVDDNNNSSSNSTPVSVGGGPAVEDRAEGISFWEYWKTQAKWFVYEDDNAATHLVKNAFGGRQRQLFTGVLTVDTPTSKTMRDDVTVQVIFFGDVL